MNDVRTSHQQRIHRFSPVNLPDDAVVSAWSKVIASPRLRMAVEQTI